LAYKYEGTQRYSYKNLSISTYGRKNLIIMASTNALYSYYYGESVVSLATEMVILKIITMNEFSSRDKYTITKYSSKEKNIKNTL